MSPTSWMSSSSSSPDIPIKRVRPVETVEDLRMFALSSSVICGSGSEVKTVFVVFVVSTLPIDGV